MSFDPFFNLKFYMHYLCLLWGGLCVLSNIIQGEVTK